jgi:glycerate 2-kinase
MDLAALSEASLEEARVGDVGVDVVAIGKASREMSTAISSTLGARVRRRLTVCDEASLALGAPATDLVVGEHPVPGEGSLAAGRELVRFLDSASDADCTIFLLSGGASSLCVLPAPPITLTDLGELFAAALGAGVDITTLNKLRASTSAIAGGAVLRYVRTKRSLSLIMVDNVVSGAPWVASGLTYDYVPTEDEVTHLLGEVGLRDTALGDRALAASSERFATLSLNQLTRHENKVLADPSMMLAAAIDDARNRGYRVVNMREHVTGDVEDVSRLWSETLRLQATTTGPTAFIGVGEVTVRVRGEGRGGRCQQFAWLMAETLAGLERDSAFVARASDGRDYVEGVAGGWADGSTLERATASGIDFDGVARSNDAYSALRELGQVLEGGHTGWNLCDLYVALVGDYSKSGAA